MKSNFFFFFLSFFPYACLIFYSYLLCLFMKIWNIWKKKKNMRLYSFSIFESECYICFPFRINDFWGEWNFDFICMFMKDWRNFHFFIFKRKTETIIRRKEKWNATCVKSRILCLAYNMTMSVAIVRSRRCSRNNNALKSFKNTHIIIIKIRYCINCISSVRVQFIFCLFHI